MPATYEPIATTTLSSAASSINFTSIPGTFTDLKIILVGTASANARLDMRLNNDSSSLYSLTRLRADGSTALSQRNTNQTLFSIGSDNPLGTTIAMSEIDIFSYAGSTNKTVLGATSADKNGSGSIERCVGLYRSTSAITQVNLSPEFGATNFSIGTTATIYGILRA